MPIACALLWTRGPHWAALIAGCTIVLVAGAWDDVRGVTPRSKIAAQVAAALVLAVDGNRITGLRADPLGTLPIDGFEAFALVLWIIFTTNAINLIDGVDGLAATIALFAAMAHAALGAPLVLALALAGACSKSDQAGAAADDPAALEAAAERVATVDVDALDRMIADGACETFDANTRATRERQGVSATRIAAKRHNYLSSSIHPLLHRPLP